MILKDSFLRKDRITALYMCAEIEALAGTEPLQALTSFLPQDHYFELVKIEQAVENELKLLEGIDIHKFREFSRYQKFMEVQLEIRPYQEHLERYHCPFLTSIGEADRQIGVIVLLTISFPLFLGYLHCLMFKLSGRWNDINPQEEEEDVGNYYFEKYVKDDRYGDRAYFRKIDASDQGLIIELRDSSNRICLAVKNKNEKYADVYTSSDRLLLDDIFTLEQKKIVLDRKYGRKLKSLNEFELNLSCIKIDDPTLLDRTREAFILNSK